MEILIGVAASLATTILLLAVAFLAGKIYTKRMKKYQRDRILPELTTGVAEYLALARRLSETSPESEYRRANQLAWELAMWLPEELYKEMVTAIARPGQDVNELTVAIGVRQFVLGEDAGKLGPQNVASHAPGIGAKQKERRDL